MKNLALIKLIIIDVDGTLTDSSIYYGSGGLEIKKFSAKDGPGFPLARCSGIRTMILTGRESEATGRRMKELQADLIYQNIKNKYKFLKGFLEENGYDVEQIAYIGDDINDIYAMSLAGFVCCPFDASEEVKQISDYISPIQGGHGAFMDVISYILKQRGEWEKACSSVFGISMGEM